MGWRFCGARGSLCGSRANRGSAAARLVGPAPRRVDGRGRAAPRSGRRRPTGARGRGAAAGTTTTAGSAPPRRNSGVRWPGRSAADDLLVAGVEVVHVVGLHVADDAVDGAPVAQRAVDHDEPGVVAGAGVDGRLRLEHRPSGPAPPATAARAPRRRRAGGPRGVLRGDRLDALAAAEHAALDPGADQLGLAVRSAPRRRRTLAHTPWRSPSASPSTHTRASTRRTPSTNTMQSGTGVAGSGAIGAHRSAATSWCDLDLGGASRAMPSSAGVPYSGAHDSTKNLTCPTRSTVAAPPTLRHLEPHRQPLGQLPHVGDDADHAAAGAQLLERGGDDVEGVGVEGAEALVEEDRLEPRRAAGGQRRDLVGQREGEGEAGEERLAARQRAGRPHLPGVDVVDDGERPRLVVEHQRVGAAGSSCSSAVAPATSSCSASSSSHRSNRSALRWSATDLATSRGLGGLRRARAAARRPASGSCGSARARPRPAPWRSATSAELDADAAAPWWRAARCAPRARRAPRRPPCGARAASTSSDRAAARRPTPPARPSRRRGRRAPATAGRARRRGRGPSSKAPPGVGLGRRRPRRPRLSAALRACGRGLGRLARRSSTAASADADRSSCGVEVARGVLASRAASSATLLAHAGELRLDPSPARRSAAVGGACGASLADGAPSRGLDVGGRLVGDRPR